MSMDDKLPAALVAEAPSPFLPATKLQFAWDSVSLSAIMSCPRQYQLRVIEGWVSRNPNFAIALVFGIQFHTGLELYHKARARSLSHDEAVHHTVRELLAEPATASLPRDTDIDEMSDAASDDDDGITLRNSRIRTVYYLIRAVVWYLDTYAGDALNTYIMANGKPAVELSFRIPIEGVSVAGTPFTLCGHIDRVVSFNDFLHPSDYKTTKSLTRQFFDAFDLSHQISGYITAGQVILDRPMKSAIVDGVALQIGGVKFARHFSHRSEGHLTEYTRLLTHVSTLAQMYAEDGFYPQNTSACYFCEYKPVCRKPPSQRGRTLKAHWIQNPGWNPLQSR